MSITSPWDYHPEMHDCKVSTGGQSTPTKDIDNVPVHISNIQTRHEARAITGPFTAYPNLLNWFSVLALTRLQGTQQSVAFLIDGRCFTNVQSCEYYRIDYKVFNAEPLNHSRLFTSYFQFQCLHPHNWMWWSFSQSYSKHNLWTDADLNHKQFSNLQQKNR